MRQSPHNQRNTTHPLTNQSLIIFLFFINRTNIRRFGALLAARHGLIQQCTLLSARSALAVMCRKV